MQEVRRFKPSTVSRRMSVVTGLYRTCVIDGVLAHSPAEHVRRPRVPPESPTLGLTRLVPLHPRSSGPLLLNRYGTRMDRQAATRRLTARARASRMRTPPLHPHMLRHTFVTTGFDAGVDLRDVQIAARHADPRTMMRYD